MVFKNYYKILDLDTSRVSIDEVKVAYRLAAKKYHPDLNVGDELAEERIKDINEAYKVLSVPASKRKYDRIWNSHFSKGKKAFSGKGEKSSIFNVFLGNIDDNDRKQNKEKNKNPIKGENVETQINVTLYEAFYGLEKKISLKNADGRVKTYTVAVPQGIRDGEKIRLIGQGKEGKNGGKNGDLFIEIKINNNRKFKLQGCDIYTDLLLTPWEAALGTRANVETIDDETKVYIPQGIQSGEKIRIPNKGYKNGNNSRGDLIAEVKVMVPKQLTAEEKLIFEKLNEISSFNPRSDKK
ncbi:MAG: J domain-containing protein [Clostridia bacterium]|nr:J domain-containing protein [Clostridia bacterium]